MLEWSWGPSSIGDWAESHTRPYINPIIHVMNLCKWIVEHLLGGGIVSRQISFRTTKEWKL